jgi:hypothetical protein
VLQVARCQWQTALQASRRCQYGRQDPGRAGSDCRGSKGALGSVACCERSTLGLMLLRDEEFIHFDGCIQARLVVIGRSLQPMARAPIRKRLRDLF